MIRRQQQLRDRTFGDVTGERHRVRCVVDTDDRTDERLVGMITPTNDERVEQRARGELLRLLAQIALVQLERGLVIELEEHVPVRASDETLRAEGHPPAGTAVADHERITVETDRAHHPRNRGAAEARPGRAETRTVAGETARHDDAVADCAPDPADELGAVHARSVREHEDGAKILPGELGSNSRPGRERITHRRDGPLRTADARPRTLDRHRRDGAVLDIVRDDLAARGAAEEECRRIALLQLGMARFVERLGRAEVHDPIGVGDRRRALIAPPSGLRPYTAFRLHDGPSVPRLREPVVSGPPARERSSWWRTTDCERT